MQARKLFGLLAHPAGHSLSPMMHQAAYQALDLPYHYHAFDVHPEQLPVALQGLKALGVSGVNVTIPHKEAVIPYLDEIDEEAKIIGAVNTIVLNEACLKGYNTDGAGYVRSLLAETAVSLEQAHVLLLGAGGAAKGIAVYLIKYGCSRLTIANRNQQRAEELIQQLHSYAEGQEKQVQLTVVPWEKAEEIAQEADVVINTTPMGMWPKVSEQPIVLPKLKAQAIVSDIVYNPLKTSFLQAAEAQGAKIHLGLGMFVYQGALAFENFTGYEAPVDVMKQAVLEQLKQGG